MKNSKYNIYIFTMALISSGIGSILMEYNKFQGLRDRVVSIFAFLDGHKTFYGSLCLGLFTSILLVLLGSVINYRVEYLRVTSDLKRNYTLIYLSMRSIRKIDSYNKYSDYLNKLAEIKGYWFVNIESNKQFEPLCKDTEKNNMYFKIQDIIKKIYFASISTKKREVEEIEESIVKAWKDFEKDKIKSPNSQRLVSLYMEEFEKLDKALKEKQEETVEEYLSKINELERDLENINKYFSLEI